MPWFVALLPPEASRLGNHQQLGDIVEMDTINKDSNSCSSKDISWLMTSSHNHGKWKMGVSPIISFLSVRVVFHFHDWRKSTSIFQRVLPWESQGMVSFRHPFSSIQRPLEDPGKYLYTNISWNPGLFTRGLPGNSNCLVLRAVLSEALNAS